MLHAKAVVGVNVNMKTVILVLLSLHVIFCCFVFWVMTSLTYRPDIGIDIREAIILFIFVLLWPIVFPLIQTEIGRKIITKIYSVLINRNK